MNSQPLLRTASSSTALAFRSSSSQQCIRFACPFEQRRTLKYQTYDERRKEAKEWLMGAGKRFRRPRGNGQTNYLRATRADRESNLDAPREEASVIDANSKSWSEDQADTGSSPRNDATRGMQAQLGARPLPQQSESPFPLNPHFKSQPVLSEELREMIYLKVVRDELSVRTVSTLMGVSMERVGAVVRMKQMERDWVKQGKPLAAPYSKAVLDMVPTTPFIDPATRQTQPLHEPINELPVLSSTAQQLFISVPESRQFTREDAAKAFDPTLLSADARIPHTELLELEKFKLTNPEQREMRKFTLDMMNKEKGQLAQMEVDKQRKESQNTKVYEGRRWNFRFQDISVENAGKDGRSRKGVGWRYGMPHEDRKRGQVKIPTSVP